MIFLLTLALGQAPQTEPAHLNSEPAVEHQTPQAPEKNTAPLDSPASNPAREEPSPPSQVEEPVVADEPSKPEEPTQLPAPIEPEHPVQPKQHPPAVQPPPPVQRPPQEEQTPPTVTKPQKEQRPGSGAPSLKEAPPPAQQPAFQEHLRETAPTWWPWISLRGVRPAFLLSLCSAFLLALASLTRELRSGLELHGLFPTTLRLIETIARLSALALGLGVVAALAPANLLPMLSWILIGLAVAIGWTSTQVLPDLMAWGLVQAEGKLQPGLWVRVGDNEGLVLEFGLRTTTLRASDGSTIDLPNRRWLTRGWQVSPGGPVCEVKITTDGDCRNIREILETAALFTPWTTGKAVAKPTELENQWSVSVRLISSDFEEAFRSAYSSVVAEVRHQSR